MSDTFNIKSVQVDGDNKVTARTHALNKVRQITSAELFSGGKELVIEHANERYVLRHTNQGKLILTK
ncbi:MAG: hypothetical protein B7Y16_01780 [Methylotenera sp. 24-45-7]|jgi:hemin uptake protein HemP|nr:MAG: hypothetical protein B7Y72_01370 [Mehylophilales bacterium 35-46-6]OYZ41553.1 MAG: hypothetical protein B7Y16_01780 [Methylotenera sp. 24-45-7]OZA09164.1 MAG: hypothetical protein B7X97_03635 [Methylotenera sp. 17-45-7]OZA49870.1 MAG: hypothetical protein B7X73_07040 [Methylophilales bacterium 39-45-7]HQS37092.1 hemin uptake protein HemP [Methylotenera sp.]